MNSILITEPVATFHGVIEVPSPVIFVHITESGIDSTLKYKLVTVKIIH
jgi:hypothetical protein